jgi:hypothetical protein
VAALVRLWRLGSQSLWIDEPLALGRAGERVLALGAVEPVFHYDRGPLPAGSVWPVDAPDPA